MWLQSSRLNNQDAYDALHLGIQSRNIKEVKESLLHAMRNTHGHNFKVTIEAKPKDPEAFDRDWVVPDKELISLLGRYSNVNLSLLEEFLDEEERATTENLALMLFNIISDEWPDVEFSVAVSENENIEARHP